MGIGTGPTAPDRPALRRSPRRRDVLRTLGAGGLVGLAGCSGGDGGGAAGTVATTEPAADGSDGGAATATTGRGDRRVQGRWISGSATDAESLYWIRVADAASSARVGLTLDGAYAVTHEEELFPLWLDMTTEDKRVYECTLREGLEWSDPYGAMTAEDWVYLITEVFQGEDNWAGFANRDEWIRNGEFIPVEQTGRLTFEIRLPEADPSFPLRPIMWGQYCLPKGLVERYAVDRDIEGFQQDEDIQTLGYTGNLGPYVFERWSRESEFVATRNPDYYLRDVDDLPEQWRGAPYFEADVIKVIPEESTRLAALRTGEITATGIPPNKVNQFEQLDSVQVVQTPQPFTTILIYNQRANGWGPLRNRAVRWALGWAVNKRVIVDSILRGYADVAHTFQPEWSRWYDASRVVETGVGATYDPARARSLLADALPGGYRYDGDTLVGPDGDQVRLEMVWAVGSDTTRTTAEFIAQEYGKVGIDVDLTGVQFNTMLQKYAQNATPQGETPDWNSGPFNAGNRDEATSEEPWDLMYGIRFNTYPRTPTDTRPFWEREGGVNFYGYVPSVDMQSLYDAAESEVDEARRREVFAEIFGVLSADQPCNFLSLNVSISGYQADVAGFGPREFGFGWDSATWYFDR